MKNKKYSILVDESTDRSALTHLSVVVKTCTENHNVQDELLYTNLVNFFKEQDIPYLSKILSRICC